MVRGDTPLEWTVEHEQVFRNLKEALVQAPILTLPNISKPFQLYVHERKDIAKGALTQILGPWERLIVYISQRLNPAAFGWPPCLRATAAIEEVTSLHWYRF